MLKGKTAVITGGSRGIGKAIALKFAENGANIVLNYNSSTNIDELLSEIEKFNVSAYAVKADVSNFKEAEELIKLTKEKFGAVDILVNNAGITRDNLIIRMTEEEFDSVINVNLKGAFNCIRQVSPIMLRQGSGKIINISSVVGISGNAGQANYAASKAGVIGLTKSVARELSKKGINVNAVAPGFIETSMTDVLSDKVKENIINSILIKRMGKPEDVANLVLFLASNSSNYITGQVINIDGGMVV